MTFTQSFYLCTATICKVHSTDEAIYLPPTTYLRHSPKPLRLRLRAQERCPHGLRLESQHPRGHQVTFSRPGQATLYVSYEAKQRDHRLDGSSRYEGKQSTTTTTSYTYRDGIVQLHPPKRLSEDNSLRPSQRLEQLITLLTSEARVDLKVGTMTFYASDPKKTFILRRAK